MSRVQGLGPALTALVSGSVVLGGKLCACFATAGSRLWETASTNPAATAELQEAADAAARKRAATKAKAAAARRRKRAEDDDQDDVDDDSGELTEEQLAAITAPPVPMVRRGTGDALAVLGLGGLLGAAGLYAGAQIVGPMIADLVGGNGSLIVCGGAAVWSAAAWMVAPPPAPVRAEADDQDVEDDDFEDAQDVEEDDLDPEEVDDQDVEEDQGSVHDRLGRHILEQLADLEQTYGGKGGLHVVTLIASAEAAGLLSPGATTTDRMRDWLRAAGFPVNGSTRQPKGVPTSIPSGVGSGVKVEDLRQAFGTTLAEAVRIKYGAPVQAPVAAPVQAPLNTPAEAPAEAPVAPPAAAPYGPPAGAVPRPRLYLVKPSPLEPSQDGAQDAV